MAFLRRWTWIVLLILFSFTALYSSGIDNGASHDKLKYLSIAWSMAQSGHYLIPMVNGIPYTDKPPLLFWLIVSVWHLFGANLFSVQCVINLLLISWALMTRAMYATLFPSDTLGKNVIPYLLIGSYAVWRDVWFLRVDILLLTGVLLCNLGVLKVLAKTQARRAYSYIVFGVCVGLFAKGPIVYVFTLLPFIVSTLCTKNYRPYCLKIIGALLLGSMIFLGTWAIPAVLYTSHAFAQQILYQQIAHRAVHSDKSYFIYLYQYIPTLFAPWMINVIFFRKLGATFKQVPKYSSFIFSIFIVSIIIFSCFGQKSLWYVLPLLPFGLIFFTRFFIENKHQRMVIRLNRTVFSVIFGFFGVLSMGLLLSPTIQAHVFKNFGGHFSLSPWVMVSLTVMSFMTLGYICFSKRNLIDLISVASVMLFLIYSLSNLYFSSFERAFTRINQVGSMLHAAELNHTGIVVYQSDYLGQFDYVGRLTEVMPVLNAQSELEDWLRQHPHGMVIYNGNTCPTVTNLQVMMTYRERASLLPMLLCQPA